MNKNINDSNVRCIELTCNFILRKSYPFKTLFLFRLPLLFFYFR